MFAIKVEKKHGMLFGASVETYLTKDGLENSDTRLRLEFETREEAENFILRHPNKSRLSVVPIN